ncbi:hypothetical protein [Shewanella cyperi]|uniref:hypothetical protein n=1 Tax=Shewanella cyperi TaxID=2814292 RepID=UPI001A94FC47|nr:hypothetical protein [Shewanella cyperi]QSX40336.1 hypothetical protein JYB84_15435 [Shewanella cyperi]
MLEARTGKPLSTRSVEAATLYQEGVDLILGSESGAAETLDRALTLDHHFALAAAARYCIAMDAGEPDAERFRDLAQTAAKDASDWEQQHVEVLLDLIEAPGSSRDLAMAYVEQNPADLLIVSQLAGRMFFFDGPKKLETVLALFESVAPALGDDWALLARLGFAASEAGQRPRGRELLQRALTLRPQSLYSIHGMAHLLHDEGAAAESSELLQNWLKQYEAGAREGQMYGHVQWHLALSEWQLGQRDAAMARYQSYCAPATTSCGPILTLADCGGFLLRDFLKTGQTRPLNNDVLKHIESVWPMLGHPFIALHVAALYASAGDINGLQYCEEALAALPDSPNRDLSLALVRALDRFSSGDFQGAADILASLSPEVRIGIGGSHVERMLVELLECACQAHLPQHS